MSVTSNQGAEESLGSNKVGLSLRHELKRKALHLLFAAVPIGYAAGLSRTVVIWLLSAALAVAVVVEIARARSTWGRHVFDSRLGSLLREHERSALSGATWLIIALLVAAVAFPRDVAVATMCAVSFGDATAAIVGRTLSRSRSRQGKSFVGSVGCFVATAIAARTIAGVASHEALIAGVLASLGERPQRPLDDNLRISLVVGCGILLWRMGFS